MDSKTQRFLAQCIFALLILIFCSVKLIIDNSLETRASYLPIISAILGFFLSSDKRLKIQSANNSMSRDIELIAE